MPSLLFQFFFFYRDHPQHFTTTENIMESRAPGGRNRVALGLRLRDPIFSMLCSSFREFSDLLASPTFYDIGIECNETEML